MDWSVLRKATEEDYEKMEKAFDRFCRRHNLDPELMGGFNSIESVLEYDINQGGASAAGARYLRTLWRRIVKYTLKHPMAEGISHDTVGFTVR